MAAGEERSFWHVAVGVVLILILLGGAVVLVWALIPSHTPRPKDPNFVDMLFASRLTITTLRVTLFVAAFYIVLSIGFLISRGQWVIRAGPIQVSEQIQSIARDRDQLAAELSTAQQTITTLQTRLENTLQTLKDTRQELQNVAHRSR